MVPLFSLVRMEVATYEPDACPLCERGLPVIKPGSRAS
jgi:orotate phosphoribosyltransferase